MYLEHGSTNLNIGDTGTKELLQCFETTTELLGQDCLTVDELSDADGVGVMADQRTKHEVLDFLHGAEIVGLVDVVGRATAVELGQEDGALLFEGDGGEADAEGQAEHLLFGEDHLSSCHLIHHLSLNLFNFFYFLVNSRLSHFDDVFFHLSDFFIAQFNKVEEVGTDVVIFRVHYVIQLVQVFAVEEDDYLFERHVVGEFGFHPLAQFFVRLHAEESFDHVDRV